MKCYRKNGSDEPRRRPPREPRPPSMKCYRKNGSDLRGYLYSPSEILALNEVLPKER